MLLLRQLRKSVVACDSMQNRTVQKNFFLENTLSPLKIVRMTEKTPQKKIRFDSSSIRHGNRVIVFSLKSGKIRGYP